MVIIEVSGPIGDLRRALAEEGLTCETLRPAAESDPRGIDRRLETTLPDPELVAIGALGTATTTAVASVLREYIKSRRKRVAIKRANGEAIEIEGSLAAAEIERMIDAERTHPVPKDDSA
jgi:hypothetical protein